MYYFLEYDLDEDSQLYNCTVALMLDYHLEVRMIIHIVEVGRMVVRSVTVLPTPKSLGGSGYSIENHRLV